MADALPRLLDIRAFVEARATEITTLLSGLQSVKGPGKFGAPALSRHLRRRATSHQRHVRIRRPNLRLAASSKRRKLQSETPDAGNAGAERSQPAAPAHAALVPERPTNRSMRRRPARMWSAALHRPCMAFPIQGDNLAHYGSMVEPPVAGAVCHGSSTQPPAATQARRLETHAWHARRMHMHGPLWGHHLALQLTGRGHGSRSFLHQMRCNCVMHDASYWGCLQLSGHQHHVFQVLHSCSDTKQLQELMCQSEVMCGAVEWQLCLHTYGMYPAGAISPVRGLWVPTVQQQQQQQAANAPHTAAAGHLSSSMEPTVNEDGWYEQCLLWLWVHPAAFQQAAVALQHACTQLSMEGKVTVSNLSQRLARIEVLGGACDAVVHATVQPHFTDDKSTGSQLWHSVYCMQQQEGRQGVRTATPGGSTAKAESSTDVAAQPSIHIRPPGQTPWVWPKGCVVGVMATDPRLASPVCVGSAQHQVLALPGRPFAAEATMQPAEYSAAHLRSMLRAWPDSGDWTDGAQRLFQACQQAMAPQPAAAAGAVSVVGAPTSTPSFVKLLHPEALSDASVASLRQQARNAALHLPSQQPESSVGPCSCLVLLVRQQYGATPGWSLILPAGWVMPFWLKLAFQGVRPAGQLEWRWVAAQAAEPCVPWDYPHTEAWHSTMKQVAAVQAAWAQRRPAGRLRRPPSLLPYIPWERVGKKVSEPCGLHQPWSHKHMGVLALGQTAGMSELTRHNRGAQQLQQQEQGVLQVPVGATIATTADAETQMLQGTVASQSPVHVLVRLLGKGTCLEGAEILWAPATAEQLKCDRKHGPHAHESTLILHDSVVLGYVTAACPRGTGTPACSGVPLSSAYPDGLGVVGAQVLGHAMAHAGGSRWGTQPRLTVHVQNPGTTTIRLASLVVL